MIMRRSIWAKLISAFFAISALGCMLTVLFTRTATVRDFRELVLTEAQGDFVAAAAAHYGEYGSWEGIFVQTTQRPQATAQDVANKPGEAEPGPQGQPFVFALADADGRVVLPASPYALGATVQPDVLAEGAPVWVEGQQVGTALTTGRYPDLNEKELEYLDRAVRATLDAGLAATLVALALGVILAASLTKPIRRLTTAARSMARGELDQNVEVTTKDELGELAQAFNQMSADLRRSDEVRRQMTADVAHELRTPLTVISGYLEALSDGVLQPSEARYAAMYLEAQHLMHLVDDLRTLSLADARSLSLSWDDLAPRSLLDQVALVYGVQAERHGVEIVVKADSQLPKVRGDSDRLLQVLGNLVSNALRYTPPGGRITLSAARAQETILLAVEDTGSGIALDDLPHVFDRFYRDHREDDAMQNQTGLGLAIARSLVDLHGGTIEAKSVLGKGSTFVVRLPVAR